MPCLFFSSENRNQRAFEVLTPEEEAKTPQQPLSVHTPVLRDALFPTLPRVPCRTPTSLRQEPESLAVHSCGLHPQLQGLCCCFLGQRTGNPHCTWTEMRRGCFNPAASAAPRYQCHRYTVPFTQHTLPEACSPEFRTLKTMLSSHTRTFRRTVQPCLLSSSQLPVI